MMSMIKNLGLRTLSHIVNDKDGKVVFYHDLTKSTSACKTPTKLDLFAHQIEAARNAGWSPSDGLPKENNTFNVAFDDGFRGVYDCKDDLLKLGVKPTVNLAVALVGTEGYLTRSEILELQAAGFVFQSHTWNHAWLPECDDAQLRRELLDSRLWLEDFLQKPVEQICFPRGLFSAKVYEKSIEYGYKFLVSCIPGSINTHFKPKVVHRLIAQNLSPDNFVSVLNGAMSPFKSRYIKRQYL